MQDSKIEWTDHTFNPWRGCTKVSAGCANCYAETLSHRNPGVLGIWGDEGTRVVASESAWREPIKWDRKAKEAGERHRVFCASLADVFEDREELLEPRDRLFGLIAATRGLDWLILTKRPEGMARYFRRKNHWGAAAAWRDLIYGQDSDVSLGDGLADWPPRNVWAGTSVESEKYLHRIDTLKGAIPARSIAFLSVEPLLGPMPTLGEHLDGIDWVIVGGESGPHARPMNPDWVRSIRDQCVAAGVPFFFKQWGEWMPFRQPEDLAGYSEMTPVCLVKKDGRVIRPYAQVDGPGHRMARVGKKAAGRMLDGRTWDELPTLSGVPT